MLLSGSQYFCHCSNLKYYHQMSMSSRYQICLNSCNYLKSIVIEQAIFSPPRSSFLFFSSMLGERHTIKKKSTIDSSSKTTIDSSSIKD